MTEDNTEVATLELTEDADYGDIETVVGALETVVGVSIESNEDGTYTITRTRE
jgi:hypothetical protein